MPDQQGWLSVALVCLSVTPLPLSLVARGTIVVVMLSIFVVIFPLLFATHFCHKCLPHFCQVFSSHISFHLHFCHIILSNFLLWKLFVTFFSYQNLFCCNAVGANFIHSIMSNHMFVHDFMSQNFCDSLY